MHASSIALILAQNLGHVGGAHNAAFPMPVLLFLETGAMPVSSDSDLLVLPPCSIYQTMKAMLEWDFQRSVLG